MDKYEFQIKKEHIEKLLEKKEYRTAAKIADSIDWKKIHDVELLMQVSSVYENLERYEDSYEILNIAYDNAPIGRMVVYKMVQVAVKMGDIREAEELYREFVKIAPHDLGRYVLKYEIYKGRGESLEDQIAVLKEYRSCDYQEQWAYELAALYYKAGMKEKCVEECDDLILWFSEGEYVAKAMELKRRIQPLTASQEEKYREMVEEEEAKQIEVKPVNMEKFNTTNLQAAVAEGLQEYISEAAEEEPVSAELPPEREQVWETIEEAAMPEEISGAPVQPLSQDTFPMPKFLGQDESGQLTFNMEENVLERQITGQLTIEDIMKGWEEKKKETEAAIAEAAKRDEERKKERERLRATGQLPELNLEVKPTLPEEIQRLIDEIEGRIPVKVHVEPIMREDSQGSGEGPEKEPKEILSAEKIPEEILEILGEIPKEAAEPVTVQAAEAPESTETAGISEKQASRAESKEEVWSLLREADEISEILEAEVFQSSGENQRLQEEKQKTEEEASQETGETSVSPMIDGLQKALEEEFRNIPPGRLSKEQEKLFSYFTSVSGMSHKLAVVLENERLRRERREDSLSGNIVITGEWGNGKTTLAADIVKALQRQRGVKDARLAKVDASSLNGKNVSAVIEKLGGGALLVERAGGLKTETAVQLSHAMTRKTGGLLVLLEDEAEEIANLFVRCESLGAKFTYTIDIPTFSNKELVAFGEAYALERDCVLDEMAVLALYNRIGNNQTSDHLVNVAEVKEMIDEAIEREGKKGIFGKVKKSRRDEFGHTVLLEKDFEI